MTKLMMTKLVVVILLALTMPASAQDIDSANYFLPGCKAFLVRDKSEVPLTEIFASMRCAGFVDGLVYGVGGKDFCRPNGATIGQALAVVVKYIEARPERMHEPFGLLAIEALKAAWPCKR